MRFIFCLFILSFLSSCNNSYSVEEMEMHLDSIEREKDSLSSRLETLEKNFLKPFKDFENIMLKESSRSPDSIIIDYERLIKNYPNSYWMHEAKKRIENINNRRKYWSEDKGWELPKNGESKVLILESISCPGC